jgi:hypothetical protein
MIKELKYFFFILIIFLFIFFTLKYYFSDENKKKSYRSLNENYEKIIKFSKKIILLKNDTAGIIAYIEKKNNKDKKNYNFWKLINKNE